MRETNDFFFLYAFELFCVPKYCNLVCLKKGWSKSSKTHLQIFPIQLHDKVFIGFRSFLMSFPCNFMYSTYAGVFTLFFELSEALWYSEYSILIPTKQSENRGMKLHSIEKSNMCLLLKRTERNPLSLLKSHFNTILELFYHFEALEIPNKPLTYNQLSKINSVLILKLISSVLARTHTFIS